ncbi:MAG TPA: hypothetical protein VJ812_04820 [Gemmatimonadaceae bacterium]|nr:hypothetical protein [Gemmatimonadaceae bacterium]
MYSACIFCHRPLGSNALIEQFPVGRRLAFDPGKGRLWVVCRGCERWNLTPLEERWEAIEECERRFRDTTLRVSTDNIGLARLPDGLELVRIGEPLRPELAAWRYGDQFGRRRLRALATIGVSSGALGALGLGGIAVGALTAGSAWSLLTIGDALRAYHQSKQVVGRVATANSDVLLLRGRDLGTVRVPAKGAERDGEGWRGWRLEIQHDRCAYQLSDDAAVRAASLLLARINRLGGSKRAVERAVRLLDAHPSPDGLFDFVARDALARGRAALADQPLEARLALEMAAHEDSERRALSGELTELTRVWREAEEIAAIADDLFLPIGIEEWLGRRRDA